MKGSIMRSAVKNQISGLKMLTRLLFCTGILLVYLPASAQTQSEINMQTCSEYKSADQKLNTFYRQILTQYQSDKVFIAKLKASQRAWVAFRDAELEAIYPADDKHSEYGSVYSACSCTELTTLTNQRIAQLSSWLTAEEGDICSGNK